MAKTMTKAERRAAEKANKKAPVPAPVPAPVETKTTPAPAPAPTPVETVAPAVDPTPVETVAPAVDPAPVETVALEEKEIENTLSYKEIVYAAYNAAYDDLDLFEKAYNEAANVYIKNEFARKYNETLEHVKELEAELMSVIE